MGMIYEGLLLFGPLMVIVFFYSFLVDFSDRADPALASVKRLGLQLTIAAMLLAYFVWSWSKGRCTLPMQTLGLKLKTVGGADVTVRTALIRALIAIPSVFFGVGFLWAIFDRDSQTLHDRLAGTRLIYVPVNKIL
ncbi:MAG: RDD family protein [Burkholderiaceae bacterium]|nr:RDD family protein [Burkholderiaceae bacterium]